MNILFVTPYPPYPLESGGKIRAYHLIREAARRHRVALLTVADSTSMQAASAHLREFLTAFEVYPVEPPGWLKRKSRPDFFRHFHSPALRRRLREVLRKPGIDLVHVEELCLADVLPRTGVPRVLGRQKIDVFFYRSVYESDGRIRRFRWQTDLVKLLHWERQAKRRFQGHVLCSRVDAARLGAVIGKFPHRVVPNGVDLAYFAPAPSEAGERRTLVFIGTMDYPPNADGAQFFVESIWPEIRRRAPDVETLFVGRNPPAAVQVLGQTPGITVTGAVPDVRPYLRDAAAVIVPVRIGEGTRLKILEAMAMQKPVVSTVRGAEGLLVKDDEHIHLARDAAQFADRTLRLLDSSAEQARIAEGGYRVVRERYDWSVIGAELAAYYEEIAGGSPS
ncbi:MAG: glycosyltransferase [Planctomycetes bacterium]|nr:glycosyltransferase [Planctomycetota bacterium]